MSATLHEEKSQPIPNTISTPAKRPDFPDKMKDRWCFIDLEEGSTACPPPSPESQDTEANNEWEEATKHRRIILAVHMALEHWGLPC